MTGDKERFYWQSNDDWFDYDEITEKVTLKDDAPERAKKSYEYWLKNKDRL